VTITVGFADADGATRAALAQPRAGDVFTNTKGLWVYVVESLEGRLTTLEFQSPEEIRPEDAEIVGGMVDEFGQRFRDADGRLRILLVRRDVEVYGWLERARGSRSRG
jgi:hypothetical protein